MHPLFQSMSLADVCTKITDGSHYSPKSVKYGCCMASVKDLTEFGINLSTCRRISKEDFLELVHQGCKPEINDILIAKDGNSCLDTVCLHTIEQEVVLLSSVAILRPDTSIINPKYLALYLSDSRIKSEMKDTLVSGSAIPRVVLRSFKEFKVAVPPLPVQYRIAEIIGTLDDKIELNRRMNETLEQMAMALYKHWFVDFGPFQDGEFVESELGMIPKGWEVVNIGSAVQIFGGGTPSTKTKAYWEDGTINWFSPTDLTAARSLFIEESSKKITKLGLENSSARLFPPQSIMMTSRATIGEITINRSEACTNQGFITMIPNGAFSLYQIYGWLRFNRHAILSIANGSTFQEVSKSSFKSLKITKPCGIEEYLRISHNIFAQIDSLISENKLLIETRDYLLPRLLSGVIDLDIVEDHLEEVISDVNAPVRV